MAAQEFDTQFRAMRAALARRGINIEVAYTSSGEPDYLYEVGRLLVGVRPGQDPKKIVSQVLKALPGAKLAEAQPHSPLLRVISIDQVNGQPSVPRALALINKQKLGLPPRAGEFPTVTPVHIFHIAGGGGIQPNNARICPATEPDLPYTQGGLLPPWPPVAPGGGAGAVIGIADTGLLADTAASPWLSGVVAAPDDTDPLGPPLPGQPLRHAIQLYCGHGTFAAGIARSQATNATVQVARDFANGAETESEIAQKVGELMDRDPAPNVINVSAGTSTRCDWPPLGFLPLYPPKGEPTFVITAAAGNDGSDRPFWPAAFDWAVGVGALAPDQRTRAGFSNYGCWVDVYAPGEDLVNAFATGQYTYQWPPQSGAVQDFAGRARWSGTSFSAPLVAGLIAAVMTQHGLTAAAARDALLNGARAASPAFPVLLPWPSVNNMVFGP